MTRLTAVTATLLTTFLPATACPSAGDTRAGVEVTYADGTRSIITRDATGAVREAEYLDGDTPYIYIAGNGVLETGYLDPHSDTSDTFSYTFDTDDLLPVRAWSGRAGEQITTDADGTEINRIPFTFRTRGETEATIGDCAYRAIPLETYYYEPGEPSMVEYIYLLDLDIPVITGHAYFGDGFGGAEPNPPVSIRAADNQ